VAILTNSSYSTCAPVRTDELEVSVAKGAHLHCSHFSYKTPNAAFSWSNSAIVSYPLVVAIRGIAALP
jgi:hypothetical protein